MSVRSLKRESTHRFGLAYSPPKGMPLSVFNDRYAREVNGQIQGFTDRVREMVHGNTKLDPDVSNYEIDDFIECASVGLTPLSGRHLQHGDNTQPDRNIEVFTNCSTAAFSFLELYLLLNGSGVGRDYSTESCRVDWEYMPNVRLVLEGGEDNLGDVAKGSHSDFLSASSEFNGFFDSVRDATHKYDSESEDVRWIKVRDSREGWAESIAILETAAFHRNHRDSLFILDFSGVRHKGSPIKGMQNRPAQGPLPLMRAIAKVATIKGAKMKPWKQALFIDHYLAACVVMGDVRRCLPKGTLIHLKRGLVPIESVQVGDEVLTSNGYYPVAENIAQGPQKILSIDTQMGQFRCTAQHRIAVLTGIGQYEWKRAKDLQQNDRMVFVDEVIPGVDTVLPEWSDMSKRSKSLVIPSLTPVVAWFLGALHVDGYVYRDREHKGKKYQRAGVMIPINQDEYYDALLSKIQDGFAAFGFEAHEQPSKDNCRRFLVTNRQFANYLFKHFKQPRTELVVPECIRLAKVELRAAYLAGLLDSDGSVKTRPIDLLMSVYRGFVRQVQSLYSSLGIPTRIKSYRPKKGQVKYRLSLMGDLAISKFQLMIEPHAIKKVSDIRYSSHTYSYPKEMVYQASLKDHQKWTDQSGQMAYECAVRCEAITRNLIPIKVKSIHDDDISVETYDLSVPDVNEFVAEGLLVHNSARMATKWWKDRDIIEFIDVKRGGFLWSANNSILVDKEFWEGAKNPKPSHARRVFEAAIGASYYDKTGEPGFINTDLLNHNITGIEKITSANYLNPHHGLKLHPKTYEMIDKVLTVLKASKYPFITNPCQPGWAPILTPSGISRLSDIKVGDKIWAPNGWTNVIQKWSSGVKSVYRYRTTAGVFYGTDNHRILQEGMKTEVGSASSIDICLGDAKISVIDLQAVMDGLVIGDGSRHRESKHKVYLDCGSDQQKAEYLNSEIGAYLIEPHPVKAERAYVVETTITHEELPPLPERIIPDRYYYGSSAVVSSFLRGLFSANGSCGSGRVTLKSTSLKLVEQVQIMLSSLGVKSHYITNHQKMVDWHNGDYLGKVSYDININVYHARQFAKEIGFIQSHKTERLSALLEKKPRGEVYQKQTFDIIDVEYVADEEVFDITVDNEAHAYWTGGILSSNCGEIVLAKYGGYCVIGDVVLSKAVSLEAAKRAIELTTRALIRTNTMPALYKSEVDRTNRIGVGITGIFEYAWTHFGLGFDRLIGSYSHVFNGVECEDEQVMRFWNHIDDLRHIVETTAITYSKQLGLCTPHTFTTIKPSGTISKVMACTEGAHLPPFLFYIRWVICKKDSEKHRDYVSRGYLVRDVSHQYHESVIIGFPAKHPIVDIIPKEHLKTASDVTPEDQFKWVRLLEHFWFGGANRNNQVSYTLKYSNSDYTHDQYGAMIMEWQQKVRCCAVMPFEESSAYAYLPEEQITEERYLELISKIDLAAVEDYDEESLVCEGGACPIEPKLEQKNGQLVH